MLLPHVCHVLRKGGSCPTHAMPFELSCLPSRLVASSRQASGAASCLSTYLLAALFGDEIAGSTSMTSRCAVPDSDMQFVFSPTRPFLLLQL